VATRYSPPTLDDAPPLPGWVPTYDMAQSTIIMPCNYSGWTDPRVFMNWGVVDFDWSNARELWSNAAPMDCEERLLTQATIVKASTPTAKVMIYRNMVKALPWYTEVREKMLDPAYAGWFLRFREGGSAAPSVYNYSVPPCTGAKCSAFYHDQQQTPEHGAPGQCVGVCDCGEGLPCGEYLWDHRNASLRTWMIDEFLLGAKYGLGNANVDGYYLDDSWGLPKSPFDPAAWRSCDTGPIGGATEEDRHCSQDMGLSAQDVIDIHGNWSVTSDAAKAAVLAHGGATWGASSIFRGTGSRSSKVNDVSRCHNPSTKEACTAFHRQECTATSASQTSAYIFELTKNSCDDPFGENATTALPWPAQDTASFLLTRGKFAWLGHNWMGCMSNDDWIPHLRPAELDVDYGTPVDALCAETAPNSGIFKRAWTKADVAIDCNKWEATITMK
jgi:hypothetical protein